MFLFLFMFIICVPIVCFSMSLYNIPHLFMYQMCNVTGGPAIHITDMANLEEENKESQVQSARKGNKKWILD